MEDTVTMTSEPSTGVSSADHWSTPRAGRVGPRRSRLGLLLLATDALCVLTVVLLLGHGEPAVLVSTSSALAVHAVAGLYRPRPDPSVLDDLPLLLGGSIAAIGVASIAQGALGIGQVDATVLRAVLVQATLVTAARTAVLAVRRGLRATSGE